MKTASKVALAGGLTALGLVTGAAVYGLSKKNQALAALTQTPAYKVTGPLVSVVIPTLQEEHYLGPLLTSIANQTYQPLEVIVSDSSPPASQYATAVLVNQWRAFLNIRMVDSPAKNVSLGRNTGAREARGEGLFFIDADCVLAPDYIEQLAADLARGAVMSHGLDCLYDDDLCNTVKSFYLWFKPRLNTTRGVLLRADDFWTIGGYREDYDPATTKFREDLDLGSRVEQNFGPGSVWLDRGAVLAESHRRPWSSSAGDRVWAERGWRKGKVITYYPIEWAPSD